MQLVNNNGILTVDSRVLANTLNITHDYLRKLVRLNLAKFEFYGELSKVTIAKQSTGRGGNIYYLFNQQQAVLLTGLTKRQNKNEVTKLIVSVYDVFNKKQQLPLTSYAPITEHPGITEITDANITHDPVTAQDYIRDNGFALTQLQVNQVTRRTATVYRVSKGRSPVKGKKVYDQRYRYSDNDVAYIVAAIKSVM
jgi:hypothetical protein